MGSSPTVPPIRHNQAITELPFRIIREEAIQAWIIDDTSYPKKGKHSVGVARQYCGERGKQDNCQVAVSLSVATHQASLPIAYQLYLPQEWADDPVRRAKAGVPEDVVFQTKPEIALRQMRAMLAAGVSPAVALADPAYGNDGKFRAGITELGLPYALGVFSSMLVWRPGDAPAPPAGSGRAGRAGWSGASSPGPGQSAGQGTCPGCLADDRLAGGQQHSAHLAVCPAAGAAGASP